MRSGFADVFTPLGFLIAAESIAGLDPLYLWTMHAARQAIEDAGWALGDVPGRTGLVLGNLSYPTRTLTDLAEEVWSGRTPAVDRRNRFCSGLPAALAADALGITAGAFSLDAACASSLYAIKLACDRLHDHAADVMLAGGVNGANPLLIADGFTAVGALSPTGRSRPFHRDADGLVPGEGAGFVVLRRLRDAVSAHDRIIGVIRAVGLSNDGRGPGALSPSSTGQERAMCLAYQMADLDPSDISLIECHATGTPVGDLTEFTSMSRIFAGLNDVPIGSVKSNLGHLITASGVVGLIKVLAAMDAGIRPPTLHSDEPAPFIAGSPFRLLTHAEPWTCAGPRRAAINNFGFGGNNAHLIVEEWIESVELLSIPSTHTVDRTADDDVAIIGLSLLVGDDHDTCDVAERLVSQRPVTELEEDGTRRARMRGLNVDLSRVRIPPNDLEHALAQQLSILCAALGIGELIKTLPPERTSILVGMGCDAEVARFPVRLRLCELLDDPALLADARDRVVRKLEAPGVVGTLPNAVANRLNNQFDIRGPSFVVNDEQLSGITALSLATRALRSKEIDAAIVGAVDMSCEPIHEAAARDLLSAGEQDPADAAVVLVVKRAVDALRSGDPVLAIVTADSRQRHDDVHLGNVPGAHNVSRLLGHAHAASGLLHIAVGALCGFLGVKPDGEPWTSRVRAVTVSMNGLFNKREQAFLTNAHGENSSTIVQLARLKQLLANTRPGITQRRYPAHLPPVVLPHGYPSRGPESPDKFADGSSDQTRRLTGLPRAPALPSIADARLRQPLGSALVQHDSAESVAVDTSSVTTLKGQFENPLGSTGIAPAAGSSTHVEDPSEQSSPAATSGALHGGYRAKQPAPPDEKALPAPTTKRRPTGPTLDKRDLQRHSSGQISDVFGPAFAVQDRYRRQVRMPGPPLLLADRILGIDASPAEFDAGTIWSETDVTPGAWYLHQGRMPAGIMIESGQADLVLISWMGADFANQGERVYRLLGCQITFLGGLAEVGDTLRFDIHIDSHTRIGEIRMFTFHYDCSIRGVERLMMRNGLAGFFSDEELASSKGVLWRPERETVTGQRDSAPVAIARTALSREELAALAAGHLWEVLGLGFELAATHTRTPRICAPEMLLMHEVTDLDYDGGPWGRGYLRAVRRLRADDWFFSGHFEDDPCMPGSVMFEATLQSMAVYMTVFGMTLESDGWRFEPVPFETYEFQCRGQVTPSSRELVCEVFVREVIADREPKLFADVLCTVDGLAAYYCRRMGLGLSPGWVNDLGFSELNGRIEFPRASQDGAAFEFPALLEIAWGRIAPVLGAKFEHVENRKFPRLPAPPFLMISRIQSLMAELGVMRPGAKVIAEYDIPEDAWYFAANGASSVPNALLMEVCLQPCGWLTGYTGGPPTDDDDMYIRNLEGTAVRYVEVTRASGTLRTEAVLTSVTKTGSTALARFSVEVYTRDTLAYTAETLFGCFTGPAAQREATGLPTTNEQHDLLSAHCEAPTIDLASKPQEYFGGGTRLAEPMLLMIDRVTGRWPSAGASGLGRWRAEKDVNPSDWFFKAHFLQDPVQPGSLGIEGLLQLLQFAMLDLGLGESLKDHGRFQTVALGHRMTWTYRGQVSPADKLICFLIEITRVEIGDVEVLAVANGSMWIDAVRVYAAQNLAVRIVSGSRRDDDTNSSDAEPPSWNPSSVGDDTDYPALADARQGSRPRHTMELASVAVTSRGVPVTVVRGSTKVPETTRPEEADWLPVREWWRQRWGVPPGSFNELVSWALLRRYVRRVIVQDACAMAAARGRGTLLLANHQVQIESILGTMIASWLTGTEVLTVANAKHRTRWVGELLNVVQSHAAQPSGSSTYFLDPTQPQEFFALLDQFKTDHAERDASLMVHVSGTRQVSASQRVDRISSVFLDLAVELSMPIVPVHYAGGLPVDPVIHKLEVPYRHTAQDYIFGKPILAEELRTLPYARRRRHVLNAINALAPPSDAPHEPNLAVESRLAATDAHTDSGDAAWAAIEDALDGLPVDWTTSKSRQQWRKMRPTGGRARRAGT
ncbi:beta-ketoacyl synthase N-terminal-like domain-containing protein [Mycobacterium simiae]|uniref:beta-ketoacyl synthase N-terminal-like domain-containing protein n=1 Tax=Mycobacterium simiae TaxID=1784 RepID=UPI0022AC0B52|nr:beta-ketoacyl synthase N-terminal-like domain-containing protein [Mycobacterium simiae]